MTKFLFLVFQVVTSALLAQAPAIPARPAQLQNPDFTKGATGQVPDGWFQPKPSKDAGFRVELIEDASLPGNRSVKISRDSGSGMFGNMMQTLDAAPFRGKRIRLKTRLRVETFEGAHGHLWLRVDLPGQKMGFFDNMGARPIQSAAWSPAEIVGDVARDAVALALGFMLTDGNGRLQIAPVTLEVLGDSPGVPVDGPRPLTTQGLKNLTAFTKAFNYIRFFHPSDAAAAADWNRLAREGTRAAEGAVSAEDLARRLDGFFAPYAASARFLVKGQSAGSPSLPVGAVLGVRWNHVGFGQNERNSFYKSTREYLPLAELKAKGWQDAGAFTLLDLGEGIRLALPTVCSADASKVTLPRIPPPPKAGTPGMPEPTAGLAGSGDDRATRLGDVVLAWGVFQHFYPYFDVVATDWGAELGRALRSAAADKDGTAFVGTLKRLVAALRDGHGGVYGTGDMGMEIPSLGLKMIDGNPIVAFTGSSARSVPPGSRLLAVDGETVEARRERLQEEISAATPGWLESRLETQILAGQASTTVSVAFAAPDGSRSEVKLPRDDNPWELISQDPRREAPLAELGPAIWYVDLSRIQEKAFTEALPKLATAKGVVFDLRGYPNRTGMLFLQHLTDKRIESARWNIPIVTRPDRQGWEWNTSGRWNLPPLEPRIKGKVAVLTGGGAISYAESCLGIVEAYKLADIVGAPSAGTNGNVNPFELPGGYRITWTGMKVLKHDGSRHHGVGILPTIPVKPTFAGLAAGRDEVLEKGLEVVSR